MGTRHLRYLILILVFVFSFADTIGAEERYPAREIQIVTSSAPGGFVDTTLRFMTGNLAKILKVPVIVNNRPGSAGVAGTSYVVKAKPDGYVIGCISSKDTVVTPATIPNIPYSYTDLDPLIKYAEDYTIVFVKGNARWKTLEDLVEEARRQPGKITYGATTNSVSHFLMEGFLRQANINLLHVPLRNIGETMTRILGGNLDVGVGSLTALAGQLKAGNLRGLFLASRARAALFPEIPTLKEKGFKEPVLTLYTGFFAPSGLPKNVRKTLTEALEKAVAEPSLKEKFAQIGAVIEYRPGHELAKEIADDYRRVVKMAQTMK